MQRASFQSILQDIQIVFCVPQASTQTLKDKLTNRHVRTVHRALIRCQGHLRWERVFAMLAIPEPTARAQHAHPGHTRVSMAVLCVFIVRLEATRLRMDPLRANYVQQASILLPQGGLQMMFVSHVP